MFFSALIAIGNRIIGILLAWRIECNKVIEICKEKEMWKI